MRKVINGMIHTTIDYEERRAKEYMELEYGEFLKENNLVTSQENFNTFWKARLKNKFGYEIK